MGNDVQNVSAGKPKVGGSLWRAPAGTTLPTNATTTLAAAFKALGYSSDEGVTNGVEADSTNVVAWGGDTVLTVKSSASETYKFTLIESLSEDVLKTVYGDGNVDNANGALAIRHKPGDDLPLSVFVIEIVMTGGRAKRIVIPNGKVSEVGEVNYTDSDAIGYETTVSAFVDSAGVTAYEYISSPTTTPAPTGGGN